MQRANSGAFGSMLGSLEAKRRGSNSTTECQWTPCPSQLTFQCDVRVDASMCIEHRVVLQCLLQDLSDRKRVLYALVTSLLVEVLEAKGVHIVQQQLGASENDVQVVPQKVQNDVRWHPLAVPIHIVFGV